MSRWRMLGAGLVAIGCVAGVAASGAVGAQGDAEAGKTLYVSAKCDACHGASGAGDGARAARMKDKPTDWTNDGGGLKGLSDQQIYDSIAKGGPAIGRARAMPASPRLSEKEVWDLVAYVKTLKK